MIIVEKKQMIQMTMPEKACTTWKTYSVVVSDFDLASSSLALRLSRNLVGHLLSWSRLNLSLLDCCWLLLAAV